MPRRALLCCLAAMLACTSPGGEPDGGALPGFAGEGRLLLLLERDDTTRVAILEGGTRRDLALEDVRNARFVHRDVLLLLVEIPPPEEFGLPGTRLELLDLATGTRRAVGQAGRHYDPQPSPDGRWLAVGSEVGMLGDSDLEIWSLGAAPELVAVRHQSVEEPRWRHDGRALVASVLMADPDTDTTGGGFAGRSFHWPRLHRFRRDLGDAELLWDGAEAGALEPGGSLPLWWDARGLWARQNRGLVRCELDARRCALVFAPEGARRVVGGQRVGDEAWLLTVEARDAFDRRLPDAIVRVALSDGRALGRWRAPTGIGILEIDWIGRR